MNVKIDLGVALGIIGAAFVSAARCETSSSLATGGDVTLLNNGLEAVHSFTNAGTYTFTLSSDCTVRILLVGGGGGSGYSCSGGGGGGGMIDASNVSLSAGTYTVTVGAGGTAGNTGGVAGGNGGDSLILAPGGAEVRRAIGGGASAAYLSSSKAGRDGGCGGGGTSGAMGGAGTEGQGYAGGKAGSVSTAGGGGAGGAAPACSNGKETGGGAGGPGRASDITGEEVYYGGGGGGGGWNCTSMAAQMNGGIGGGGNGARYHSVGTRQGTTLTDGRNEYAAEAGVNGLGGGGGGANNKDRVGRPGGCGAVIIRLPNTAGNSLNIVGDPDEIGSPTPPYGLLSTLSAGDEISFSMPVTLLPYGNTSTNRLVGWKIEAVDQAGGTNIPVRSSFDAGESPDSCVYVHASDAVFTWLWELLDPVGVRAPSLVSASQTKLVLAADVTGIGFTAPSATLKYAYGLSPDALSMTNVVSSSVTAVGLVQGTLSRLTPGAVYYVKAILETNDASHDSAESEIVCYQTLAPDAIPFDYAILEYIEGRGDQYIDTGYKPTPHTRTVVDFQLVATSSQHMVFGVAVSLYYYLYQSGSGVWGYAYADTKNPLATKAPVDLARHIYDFNFKKGASNRGFTIDGGTFLDTTLSQSPTKTATYSLYLGAERTGATTYNYASHHRIFSCQMYEDDVPVRDFVPVRRKSDGAVGLYDRVYGNFYQSGYWPYTAGPETAVVQPPIYALEATENIANGALASVSLDFGASSSARSLCVAWGPELAGGDPANWYATNAVAPVAAGETNIVFQAPADWGSSSNVVMRFYFDGDPVGWSNPVFWRDYSAPVLTDVAADGTGGDTLAVSGTLASFSGADCTLSVLTGDSPTTLTNVWAGLSGCVRDAIGEFAFTLFESNTNAARYLAPGATVYASVQAVSDGKITRTPPVAAKMKSAPVFALTPSSSISRRTGAFTGKLYDLGMDESAVVTLYVGSQTAEEDEFVAVGSATVTDKSAFTISHLFDDFETSYKWQLRAVSTAAGQTATAEARSAVKTVATLDTTTYTWKPSVASGNWSDAANWTDNMEGDSLGYPQSAAATAVFASGTDATVVFTEALTIKDLNCAAGPSVTFSQGGDSAEATKLTAATFTLYGGEGEGASGAVTLDGVSIATTGDVSFGGGTLTISNATFSTGGDDFVGRSVAGGHVVFKGEHPQWYHANKDKSFYSSLATANIQLDFAVPVGGYAEAPVRAVSSQSYYLGNKAGAAGSCALTVNILDESPANHVNATTNTVLISWSKGISRNMVIEGHLPVTRRGEVSDDEFVWGDDSDYPKTLGVTIRGISPLRERATTIMVR